MNAETLNGVLTPAQRRALIEAPPPQVRIYPSSYGHGGVHFNSLTLVGPGREHCPRKPQDQHDSGEGF